MREVWAVIFEEPDFADCNAVFSDREKARAYLHSEMERCKNAWRNLEQEYKGDDGDIFVFEYYGADAHLLNNTKIAVRIDYYEVDYYVGKQI